MHATEIAATVSPLVGEAGHAYYFTPETAAAGEAVGLPASRFYYLGRGGTLGNVDWRSALSAFGYFSPSLFAHVWTTGAALCAPADAGDAHFEACADHGRRRLADVPDLGGYCAAASEVIQAALRDPGGLTLFAAYAARPLADDLPARAMQLTAILRELRGSAHLACVVAQNLPTPIAHRIRRPNDTRMFGWKEGEIPEPTEEDRARLGAAEAATDAVMARHYGVLDHQAAAALVAGVQAVAAAAHDASRG